MLVRGFAGEVRERDCGGGRSGEAVEGVRKERRGMRKVSSR